MLSLLIHRGKMINYFITINFNYLLYNNIMNKLNGGFSLDSNYNEIYQTLDKMRGKSWYSVFKNKFDYICYAPNNQKILRLNCNQAKILKYILQLNLKQKESFREYIYTDNNNVKYLNIVMIKEDIENFLISFVNMNEQLKLKYYNEKKQDIFNAKTNILYDLNRQWFKLFATFGSIFSNIYRNKVYDQDFYNIDKRDYILLYIINESLINIYTEIINAINISLGLPQQQLQSLSEYIIPPFTIQPNKIYTKEEINILENTQNIEINKKNIAKNILKNNRMRERRQKNIGLLLKEEYVPVTNVCVNRLNRCTDADYDIRNLSLIKRLFKSLDTYI